MKKVILDGRAILMRDSAQKYENSRPRERSGQDRTDDRQRKRDSKYENKIRNKKQNQQS